MAENIYRKKGLSIPHDTSTWYRKRKADSRVEQPRSGFYNFQKTIEEQDKTPLPSTFVGVVVLSPVTQIKYKLLSHHLNQQMGEQQSPGYLEGFCVYARTELDKSSKTNPQNILDKITPRLTKQERENLKFEFMNSVSEHDLFAPLDPSQKRPLEGERVKIHYFNATEESGERIKGFYEIISKENNTFTQLTEEERSFISELNVSQIEENIVNKQDEEIAKPKQNIDNCEKRENCDVTIINSPPTPAYWQAEEGWRTLKLGGDTSKSFSSIGCLVTCYTMSRNWLLKRETINPKESYEIIKKYETQKKLENYNFKIFNSVGAVIDRTQLANSLNIRYVSSAPSTDLESLKKFIDETIDSNSVAILHVDYKIGSETNLGQDGIGDHYIMAYKKDPEGNYICNDPMFGSSFIFRRENLFSFIPSKRGSKLYNATYKIINAFKLSI
jgi:hypothetical protein